MFLFFIFSSIFVGLRFNKYIDLSFIQGYTYDPKYEYERHELILIYLFNYIYTLLIFCMVIYCVFVLDLVQQKITGNEKVLYNIIKNTIPEQNQFMNIKNSFLKFILKSFIINTIINIFVLSILVLLRNGNKEKEKRIVKIDMSLMLVVSTISLVVSSILLL
jgi:hypothetical protein